MIDSKYRTVADRKHRAIVGFSMGGGQAGRFGLRHLETFSQVGIMSAGMAGGPETEPLATLAANPAKTNKQIDLLWIACGKEDTAMKGAKTLHAALDQAKIEHTFLETEGAHHWRVWRRYLRDLFAIAVQVSSRCAARAPRGEQEERPAGEPAAATRRARSRRSRPRARVIADGDWAATFSGERFGTSRMPTDTIFQMTGSTVRFGDGATREVGTDFVDLGCRRVLAIIDPAVRAHYPGETAIESLRSAGVDFDVFTDVRCEPTDGSFREAIAAASSGGFDGFLAVGGGSTIDTAKAANLYATWPADFIEYVNPTLGRGATPPGPLKPLIAVPTTAGTGSETTAVAVFDFDASASRPASRTATCVRRSAFSILRTRAAARRRSPPVPASTC